MGFTTERKLTKRVFNLTSKKEKRRVLRNNAPVAEAILWARLRREQVARLRFRRQYSVGAFVLDFYCLALKLAMRLMVHRMTATMRKNTTSIDRPGSSNRASAFCDSPTNKFNMTSIPF
ncbi:MAG TPA: DUF559 domain-containing protein [Abditibacteriaceae bacterium]|nr:DUF559 domain-containing protein [Abditibacteriaceae bacterium]